VFGSSAKYRSAWFATVASRGSSGERNPKLDDAAFMLPLSSAVEIEPPATETLPSVTPCSRGACSRVPKRFTSATPDDLEECPRAVQDTQAAFAATAVHHLEM
jgi:hypothetical protein